MKSSKRRTFIKSSLLAMAGSGFAVETIASATRDTFKNQEVPLKLGLASYSLREFDLDATIEMTNRVHLKHICLKSMHLPLDSSASYLKTAAGKVHDAGLDLYGCGVVYMSNKEHVDQAFDYAKTSGMKVIVGVPEHELLPYVEDKVKSYDIQVAIHNHGPGDEKYPSPESVIERVKDLDPRIGLCMDIGHTQRIGLNPAQEAKKYFDRLLDVHIKDVTASTPEGKGTEIGHGVIDIPGFLSVLIKNKYKGVVSFEYEEHAKDPLPGLAESVGYVRGVLADL